MVLVPDVERFLVDDYFEEEGDDKENGNPEKRPIAPLDALESLKSLLRDGGGPHAKAHEATDPDNDAGNDLAGEEGPEG